MKIYTKTGDTGETGLYGGQRVGKDSLRIAAYGDIDELNAILGLTRCEHLAVKITEMIGKLQRQLFELGSDLATPINSTLKIRRVDLQQVQQLEQWIDELEAELPALKNFILPGGSKGAACLHLARTVCRRAERKIVRLQREEDIGENVVIFVNRMSDLLFVMARYVNKAAGVEDEKWVG